MKTIGKRAACVMVLIALVVLGASGCSGDMTQDLQQLGEAVEGMEKAVEGIDSSRTGPSGEVHLIESPGQYPPGWYAGPCERKRAPEREELYVGMRYEVVDISSAFMRWDEDSGKWIGVGQSTAPMDGRDYKSPPDPPQRPGILMGSKLDPLRGPGRYQMITSGYTSQHVVKEAETVSSAPVRHQVSREEIHEVVSFTITE